eukprot:TRINITY_DN68870_c0_g1_i1.p1 TRINITY_DN68870_c0_g1~~TRINITY_DN68870_c0_g1_i1.p1  ORF type:complete len:358 (-),score=48.72 TRINITY_DN68870_c0_g1_i1:117-1112(-)
MAHAGLPPPIDEFRRLDAFPPNRPSTASSLSSEISDLSFDPRVWMRNQPPSSCSSDASADARTYHPSLRGKYDYCRAPVRPKTHKWDQEEDCAISEASTATFSSIDFRPSAPQRPSTPPRDSTCKPVGTPPPSAGGSSMSSRSNGTYDSTSLKIVFGANSLKEGGQDPRSKSSWAQDSPKDFVSRTPRPPSPPTSSCSSCGPSVSQRCSSTASDGPGAHKQPVRPGSARTWRTYKRAAHTPEFLQEEGYAGVVSTHQAALDARVRAHQSPRKSQSRSTSRPAAIGLKSQESKMSQMTSADSRRIDSSARVDSKTAKIEMNGICHGPTLAGG